MPISFACHNCGKQYRVDEKLSGKKTKCKSCGATMSVPDSVPVAQTATTNAHDDFGLEGPLDSQNDLFDCPTQVSKDCPLGNHVGDDAGLAHNVVEPETDDMSQVGHNYSNNNALASFEAAEQKKQQAIEQRKEFSGSKKKKGRFLWVALLCVIGICSLGGFGFAIYWFVTQPGF